ncbi:hypothetical protein AGABI1DRAFT_122208 [Agaricus bisporus var. burnettii JB137-S8]|uniref:Heme haloperoxidase family profile domain-containing protein n=1 Tax=Agaricus bisporus var. burnettii (strain JB137-S8 / ATCC MYA-4627 / FGSC 10392) TaxID=597362 RepID=K5WPD2_AGABU|nr:uncharacterized protein AGABI1DRAFT_122208 [Agaricus bisporus var. burnettii JB137-S8]EKM77181.1 hypothetical protein AGABI1DRAFT_122208 [Agaricus bisporus var. burnettii JB137-S8]
MFSLFNFVALALACTWSALAFPPSYASLGGLPREELDRILPSLQYRSPGAPPGPLKFNGTKLVNDHQHPWKPLKHGDIRGPCPGLNTLASHGYLPHNGIATPAQIINAVQEGFNMENSVARLVVYAAHLVDDVTGPSPQAPANAAGLNTHALFEGDASMTRADAFFGDNHSFNETLFDEFTAFSNRFGAGKYNLTVAAEYRFHRIQESIATNPNFSFVSSRFFTAYAESVFPINFFIDGRQGDGQLDLDVARGFFQNMHMPDGFHRASKPMGIEGLEIANVHPISPGANVNGVNTYTPDPSSADFTTFCLLYVNFVNQTVCSLYPSPTGNLKKALTKNLEFLYYPFSDQCSQVFPYGNDN